MVDLEDPRLKAIPVPDITAPTRANRDTAEVRIGSDSLSQSSTRLVTKDQLAIQSVSYNSSEDSSRQPLARPPASSPDESEAEETRPPVSRPGSTAPPQEHRHVGPPGTVLHE
jgi:hypothetical protein